MNKHVADYLRKRRGTQPIPQIEDVGDVEVKPISESRFAAEEDLPTADLLLGEDMGDEQAPVPKDAAEAGFLRYGPEAISPEDRVRRAEQMLAAREPLQPGAATDVGGGAPGPDEMQQLREAQRQDALAAGFGRMNLAQQRIAEVLSRGAYQAAPLAPIPSAMDELAQRRALVAEHLRQQREQRAEGREIKREARAERADVRADLATALQAQRQDALEKAQALKDAIAAQRAPEEIAKLRAETSAAAKRAELYAGQFSQLGKPKVAAAPKEKEAKAPAAEKLRQLPASDLKELSDIDVAIDQMNDLVKLHKDLDLGGFFEGIKGVATEKLDLQNTKAAKFLARSKIVQQGVGKILEGGKLAAGDEAKYKTMLPKPGDSAAVLEEKQRAMLDYLQSLKRKGIKTFQAAGFQVPDTSQPAAPSAKQEAEAAINALEAAVKTKKPSAEIAALKQAAEAAIAKAKGG